MSLYYADVARTTPVDSPEKERELIVAWQTKKDVAARNTLVNSHLRFVIKLARKQSKDPERLQDLIAAGNIGLLKAVDRFDTRKPSRFLTYAGWWIQEEIFKERYGTSSLVHVPTHRQKAQRKRQKEYRQAVVTHGEDSAKAQLLNPGLPEGCTVPMEDVYHYVAEGLADSADQVDVRSSDHHIRTAVSSLPVREQTVLNLYFGIKDDPRNFVQIANMLGMSPERVRQIKINAMMLLTAELKSRHALTATRDVY